MTWQKIKDKFPVYIAMAVCNILILFTFACPPKVTSLLNPAKKVTSAELQIELDAIISTAEYKLASLQNQQEFRDLILQNALLVVQTGTFNPVGIVTSLFAFYGLGSAGNSVRKTVKKKVEDSKLAKNLANNRGDA